MSESILTRMPAQLKTVLKQEAQIIGISLNALVLQILWDWFEKKELKEQTTKIKTG